MTQYSDHDRVIALAGIFQGARCTRDLAREGQADRQASEHSLSSLFNFDPETVEATFGGVPGVQLGLHTLIQQLEKPSERDLEIARYVVATLHLADKLRRDAAALHQLGEALSAAQQRLHDFELSETTRYSQLGTVYQEHISVISPQILVRGEPVYLSNQDTAARVRVMLLAAIRAAVLWRQTGGSKLHLLFRRSKLAQVAQDLLEQYN